MTAWNRTPPIEVVHGDFRAVAQNFFSIPVHMFVDLKIARDMKTGDEVLILFDAAELSFEQRDFERLEDMTIRQFVDVIQEWVSKSAQATQ